MRRWKIFYCDGTTFDSSQGEPNDAPCREVAVIHTEDGRCGRRLLYGSDWYRWMDEGIWAKGESFDMLFALANNGHVIARKGGYQTEAEFEKNLIRAHQDDFVPRISPDEPAHPAWKA